MAIYTTLFLCEPSALLNGFPSWKPALDQPVRREMVNPFTGESRVIESRAPEWLDGEGDEDFSLPQFQAVSINMPYEQYLEGRLPGFVRQLPHLAFKNLMSTEFNPLVEVLGLNEELDMPIYGPPNNGSIVEEFPSEFLQRLTNADVTDIATKWAATMSTPEHTHSMTGERLYADWTASQALDILGPILGLARESNSSQRLYLLTES